MSRYISLLRGINVGGQKIVGMQTLREIFTGLGFAGVRTYLQSGNVVFESPDVNQSGLARRIEAGLEQALGYQVRIFLRREEQLKDILTNNPFLTEGIEDKRILHVSFLYQEPGESTWDRLVVPVGIPDKYNRGNTVIYLYYPNGFAKSRLPTSFFEKALGVPITDRNWNTVEALYKMVIDTVSSQKN